MNKSWFLFAAASFLASCGGSDYSAPGPEPALVPAPIPSTTPVPVTVPPAGAMAPPAPADVQGVFAGTGSGGFDWVMIQLDDGSVFGLEGQTVNSVLSPRALLRTGGVYETGAFTAVESTNFFPYYGGVSAGTVGASFTPAGAFIWTLAGPAGTQQWSSTRLPSQRYDYERAATFADVSGSWTGASFTGSLTTLAVAPTGEMSGGDLYGCRFVGVVTPRPGGKNVFNVSVTFDNDPSACDNPSMTATGVGIIVQVTSTTRQFLFGVHDRGRSTGLVWSGVR